MKLHCVTIPHPRNLRIRYVKSRENKRRNSQTLSEKAVLCSGDFFYVRATKKNNNSYFLRFYSLLPCISGIDATGGEKPYVLYFEILALGGNGAHILHFYESSEKKKRQRVLVCPYCLRLSLGMWQCPNRLRTDTTEFS